MAVFTGEIFEPPAPSLLEGTASGRTGEIFGSGGTSPAGNVAPAVTVTKTGTNLADFLATLTNNGTAPTGALEIYVEFH